MYKFIAKIFVLWRVNLEIWRLFGETLIPAKTAFFGPIPWANFDGHHYILIAQRGGYGAYEQAFFPLYPVLIRLISYLGISAENASLIISNISIFFALAIFWKLLKSISIKENNIKWSITFLLFFPTSFYLGASYTESLFMLLVFISFLAIKSKKWIIYAISASLASMTRIVGAFLMFPLGLIGFMGYLGIRYNDPLLFIHALPAYGSNRTGGEIILLPQVMWRYFKIFTTVSTDKYDYWIAVLEAGLLSLTLGLLYIAWKKRIPKIWILFSLAAIIGPTLTGTLTSIPRYLLVAFPIYIVLANIKSKKIRYFLLITSYLLQGALTMLFTRGFWVS